MANILHVDLDDPRLSDIQRMARFFGLSVSVELQEHTVETPFTSNHFTDADGNPAGGATYGDGFTISWQNGPLGRGEDRAEPNGAFVENVIRAAIDRLEFYQRSKFNSEYNAEALIHLDKVLAALRARTADREARQVEGTHGA